MREKIRIREDERWLIPAVILTSGSLAAAFILPAWTGMPSPRGVMIPILVFWISALVGVAALAIAGSVLALLLRGHDKPLQILILQAKQAPALAYASGVFLVALNLTAFGLIKPQLGHIVPFTADPLLADIDRIIFGGVDGWKRLKWLHHLGLPQIYHQAWFGWVFLTVFFVLRTPSADRNALLLSYFVLWSLFGPLVHLAVPAAGPIFWSELGLGDRFAGLPLAPQTELAKNYLWEGYTTKVYNAAGGISAMPSLHLATLGWTMIALRATRMIWVAAIFTAYILMASVALGWHYIVDGIAGLVGAVACFVACRAYYSRQP